MKAFIIYPTYTNIDNQTYVQLYGRLENGESFVSMSKFNPYFFIKEKDLKKAKIVLKGEELKFQDTILKDFNENKVVKLVFSNQTLLNKLKKELHDAEVDTYEGDIKPHFRFMMDKGLLGTINIEGDYQPSERVDRVYNNPELDNIHYLPKLKIASVDLEGSQSKDKILCIGIYSDNYKKCFMITKKKTKEIIPCKDEEDLLEKFKQAIIALDPDIITGWNVIDFDFAYLKKKFDKYKISFDLGRDTTNSRLRIESGFFRKSSLDISGRLVLDGMNFIRDPFIKEAPSIKNKQFTSYSLENVSNLIVGKGKTIKGDIIIRQKVIEEFFKKNQQKLADYNLMDCQLVYEILEKTDIINLAIERSQLTGMPLDKITGSIASFDSLYIREARKRGLVSPTTRFTDKEERIKGGFVMSPKPGIYNNVLVFDFKSLYPSIIRTFNIDPASFQEKKTKNSICSPNGACFKNQEGILPFIIEKLHQAREKAKNEKRELSSYAIKTIQNSFFGVLASPNCRYFNMDMANAITNFGQELIKLTKKTIEQKHKNIEVIYMDTDSCFVNTNLTKEKANKLGKQIQEEINEFYDNYVKKQYKRKSFLELEFEKQYLALMMPAIRKIEKDGKINAGAKKRYAGLIEKTDAKGKIKEIIQIVGLESIRCFVPGNPIPTLNGIKDISQLDITDKLFGLNLKTKKIEIVSPKNIFKYNHNGKIINISIEGGHNFKVTPEHNFFVLLPSAKRSRWTGRFCRYKTGKIITKPASELKEGDYVISLNKIPNFGKSKSNERKILLARFFGYFVGEGRLYERCKERGLHQRRLDLTFGDNETELIEDCKFLCKTLFGKELHTYKEKSDKKCLTLYMDLNKNLFDSIKEDLVINNHSKIYRRTLALTHKVPKFILNGNKKIVSSFLQAYFDAEGTSGRKIRVVTISKELFEGVCFLLKRLGIQYNKNFGLPNPKYKRVNKIYIIEIGLNGFEQFSKEISFKSKYKQNRLLEELKSRNLKRARYIRPLTEHLILRKIKKIKKENYKGEVYDIEIDSKDKNYFIDYTLTHNSDWTKAAQDFQRKLLDKIFHKKNPIAFIKQYIEDLKAGKLDDKLIYKKSIRKDLIEYTKTTPPHVKAARKLKPGELTSNIIQYYITTDGPEPIQKIKHKIDYEHYIKKQIEPIAKTILSLLNIEFEDIIKGSKQATLF